MQAITAKAWAEVEAVRASAQERGVADAAASQAAITALQAAQAAQAAIVEQSAALAQTIASMQGAIQSLGGPRNISIARGPDGRIMGAQVG